jgi:hypothetical protein
VAGLEGALRLERRSANLTHLAAEARDGLRSIDTRWRISVANEGDPDARARAAGELLTEQNSKLEHVHREAARNGLDLPFEKPAELPDAPVRTKPVVGPDGPYAA